tara:strand:- start:5337 stop:6152 length:816 start_codon:yes stop_codon:yes gene_type:complete
MKNIIDIIVQGGYWAGTAATVIQYSQHPMVSRVILSTWEDTPFEEKQFAFENIKNPGSIVLLKNKKPSYEGPGNLNLHLLSSKNGLELCTKDLVLKIRSDERMSPEGITKWVEYMLDHSDEETLSYLDGTKQKMKIGVIATNINYPYHPQDHVFIGHKDDLYRLFNMPFSYEPPIGPEPVDFSVHLQNPIYIGANYFSLFFPDARKHLDNWREFLVINAPKKDEAMDIYLKNRNSIFRPLPRINMWWEKFNCQYWWDGYYNGGDRYAEDEE